MSAAEMVGDGGSHKPRVTVSLAPEVASGLKPAADHAGAASVSAYVEAAVRDRMGRGEWLRRWDELAGPVDPDTLAYARRVLAGGLPEPRSRLS